MEKQPCVVLFEKFVCQEVEGFDFEVKVGKMKGKDYKAFKEIFFKRYNELTGQTDNVTAGKALAKAVKVIGTLDELKLAQVVEAANNVFMNLAGFFTFKIIEHGCSLLNEIVVGTDDEKQEAMLKFQVAVSKYVVSLTAEEVNDLFTEKDSYNWILFNATVEGAAAIGVTPNYVYFPTMPTTYKFVNSYSRETLFKYLNKHYMVCKDGLPNLTKRGMDLTRLWYDDLLKYAAEEMVEEEVSAEEENTTEPSTTVAS